MLMNEAKNLHSKSKDKNVKFTFGGEWFEDFKKRYGIQFLFDGDSMVKSYKPKAEVFVHKLKKASTYNDGSK